MKAVRTWSLEVRDARGRPYRGTVAWHRRLALPPQPHTPAGAFTIILCSEPADDIFAPPRMAVCVPSHQRVRPVDDNGPEFAKRMEEFTLRPHEMHAFASGRIVMSYHAHLSPADIFPPHSKRPRLDRLALSIVEASEAEAAAPFVAMIRTELGLASYDDPLACLRARIAPDDPAARPPARAPAIVRLASTLRSLLDGTPVDESLEQLREDLRFLRLFATAQDFPAEALERLLHDIRAAGSGGCSERDRDARIVELSQRHERT